MPRRNDISKILIIGCGRNYLVAFLMSILIVVPLPMLVHACSVSLNKVLVTPDFRVIVSHGSTPIAGVQVEVYDTKELDRSGPGADWTPVMTLITSSDGAAEVKNLSKGVYLLETKGPGAGSAVYAEVSARHGKRSNQIELEWPGSRGEILKAKSLTGELASQNPWTPFENIHAELWTAGAREPMAVQDTGIGGHFQFEEAKPGIYILRIRGQQKGVSDDRQVEGEIPIELISSSTDSPDPLSLYLGMTSCGVTYRNCPNLSDGGMPTRRLQVHDPHGRVIDHAKYSVLTPDGAEIVTGSMGSNGIVELPSELNGKVILVVTAAGSPTFELPLELIEPTDTAEYLTVIMGVQGYGGHQCSPANLEKNATP